MHNAAALRQMESPPLDYAIYAASLQPESTPVVLCVDRNTSECRVVDFSGQTPAIEQQICHISFLDGKAALIYSDNAREVASDHMREMQRAEQVKYSCRFESVESELTVSQHQLAISSAMHTASIALRIKDVSARDDEIFVGAHAIRMSDPRKAADLYRVLYADIAIREKNEPQINPEVLSPEEFIELLASGSLGASSVRDSTQQAIHNAAISILKLSPKREDYAGPEALYDAATMTLKREDNSKSRKRHKKHHRKQHYKASVKSTLLNYEYTVRDIQGNGLQFDLFHPNETDPVTFCQQSGCYQESHTIRHVFVAKQYFCALNETTLQLVCEDMQLFLNFDKATASDLVATFNAWKRKNRTRTVE